MEMKKASYSLRKHIICCAILLVIFVVTIGVHSNAEDVSEDTIAESSSDVVPLKTDLNENVLSYNQLIGNKLEIAGPRELVTVQYNELETFISTYKEELQFFAKCFGVKIDDILEDINRIYDEKGHIIETNVGYLLNSEGKLKEFNSAEQGIVEYFYDYISRNPKKVSNKRVAYKGDAEYVENLIIYYTTKVYDNVDTNVALSIGAAESGYYKVKYMLSVNNVFGGMSKSGLTKYKNIEYGVLSYIRLLSKNYYGKGLNTISQIGYRYCPKKDNNGNKIASPHWINLVKKAQKYYSNYELTSEIQDLQKENVNM